MERIKPPTDGILHKYKIEGAIGFLDSLAKRFSPDTVVRVKIPGRGQTEMTVARLQEQVAKLRAEDFGEDKIQQIQVEEIRGEGPQIEAA